MSRCAVCNTHPNLGGGIGVFTKKKHVKFFKSVNDWMCSPCYSEIKRNNEEQDFIGMVLDEDEQVAEDRPTLPVWEE